MADRITVPAGGGISSPVGSAIFSQGGDTVTLRGNVDLGGLIDCGDNTDTLVFAMPVRIENRNALAGRILRLDPAGDT
jgi:hypothetical protein